jgi:lysophospholipase L1-like esterase
MLLLPATTTLTPSPLHWVRPDHPRLQWRGRWRVERQRAYAVNTGSQFQARFSGDRIVLRFDTRDYPHEPPQLWVRLDEHPWQAFQVAPTIELTPEPPHSSHRLQVVFKGAREWDHRWQTPLQTAVILTGLGLVPGGELLEPPPLPRLRIEFLGDSITEGVLLHRLDRPFPEAWPERADGRLGYAFQTGERLGADSRVVGFGRLGVTIEGNGGVPPAPDAFAWICAGVPKDDWKPHIVVINQGTNDGGVPSERFRPAYDRYLAVVRAGYPDAWIFALRPFNGAHTDDIRTLVEARSAGGDARLRFVDTTGWIDPERDTTDGLHPNLSGHRRAAEQLEALLRTTLTESDVDLNPESRGRP